MSIITINSISINLKGWDLLENTESKILWTNKFGDSLSINFFPKMPDLPKNALDIKTIRDFFRNMIIQSNGAIVEVEKEYLDSLLAIKTIIKFPQESSGLTFLASYTIPRDSFSFVLKLTCPERGITGMREAVILDKALGEGIVDVATRKGWFFDPYDPEFKAPLLSNLADKQEYDAQFPNSALSRARNGLKVIKENVEFSEEVLNSEKYFLDFE